LHYQFFLSAYSQASIPGEPVDDLAALRAQEDSNINDNQDDDDDNNAIDNSIGSFSSLSSSGSADSRGRSDFEEDEGEGKNSCNPAQRLG